MGRHDRPSHAAERGTLVTVAELLAQAIQDGEPVRLAWPQDDPNRQAVTDEEWPTSVMPRIQPD